MSRRVRGLLALLLVAAGCLAPGVASATGAPRATSGWSSTRTLVREFTKGGTAQTDTRQVTVTVDRTTDLQSRERIGVTWSGAHPSGGRAANPFGENGMQQEYPVVILECRGVDDPALPKAQRLSPDTCWTGSWGQRTTRLPNVSSVWTHDRFAAAEDRGQISGVPTLPATCPGVPSSFSAHVTPFVSAAGTSYPGCSSTTMPPEAAVGSADPPNEIEAFTSTDGTGSADFEVRTVAENESLGCSHAVACSLVVVPIMGISCADANGPCNQTGAFAPGSSNFANDGVNLSVSPALWWSASNWRGRFSVPLSFALPPSACDLLGTGTPVPFFGSALLGQAALQWSPAYCLNKSRFNWQNNTMPDDAAFALMTSGEAVAAEVTGPRTSDGPDPVGYAPTAVSGYGIAFDIDRPDNAGQLQSLRLDARLLAKLMTESYPGSAIGRDRPGLADNPASLNLDPEFRRLNPGLDDTHFSEAASTLLSLSTSSDVISSLTSYLAADPDAMAFISGKADPWGMVVNPAYRAIKLPVSTWPLLDTWIPDTPGQACLKNNPAPYLPKVAAPVSALQQIATAMLLSWPNVQTVCDTDPTTGLYKLGRIAPQGVGSRFMLGLVTLGDAARYGLPLASLQAAPGKYVAPTPAALAAAVHLSRQSEPTGAFTVAQSTIRHSPSAYPGMLVVSTAARLSGMQKPDAALVAQFIDIATSEGQQPGRGNGQLPAGYLPMRSTGVTGKLVSAAHRVRDAVRRQSGAPAVSGPGAPGGSVLPGGSGVGGSSALSPGTAPGGATAAAATKPVAAAGTKPLSAATTPVSQTTRTASPVARALLPLLLFLALTGGLATTVIRGVLRTRAAR